MNGEVISWTPFYHSHSHHRYVDIRAVITVESSSLHISTVYANISSKYEKLFSVITQSAIATKLSPSFEVHTITGTEMMNE